MNNVEEKEAGLPDLEVAGIERMNQSKSISSSTEYNKEDP